jgi:hypothetical protein
MRLVPGYGWGYGIPKRIAIGIWLSAFGVGARNKAERASRWSVCMHQDAGTWRPEISSVAERSRGRLRFNQLAGCRLYRRLGPCRCTQLEAGIVEMKIDRPLRQAGDFCDLSRGLPTRDPSQHLDLTIM